LKASCFEDLTDKSPDRFNIAGIAADVGSNGFKRRKPARERRSDQRGNHSGHHAGEAQTNGTMAQHQRRSSKKRNSFRELVFYLTDFDATTIKNSSKTVLTDFVATSNKKTVQRLSMLQISSLYNNSILKELFRMIYFKNKLTILIIYLS
jgi:hypothetical protein